MDQVAEYRRQAKRCRQMADDAFLPETRQFLLDAAATWSGWADELEGKRVAESANAVIKVPG